MPRPIDRPRRLLLAGSAAWLGAPALAAAHRPLAAMTEGPFYPARSWREQQHADLTQVTRNGRAARARGEPLGIEARVIDSQGRAIDRAEVEIWQCDVDGHYTHPAVAAVDGRFDSGFQGFGSARSDADGRLRFRTIRPVPYPGRTPHIHIAVRHPSFGERISQLFVAGDPGNARDFLWRSLGAADRQALSMQLEAAAADSGLRWRVSQTWVVPA